MKLTTLGFNVKTALGVYVWCFFFNDIKQNLIFATVILLFLIGILTKFHKGSCNLPTHFLKGYTI